MWRRTGGLALGRALVVILGLIGIGSFLFHTHATVWASLADTAPIGIFILTYILAANLHFWRLPPWAALALTAAFIPYAMLLTPVFRALPFFSISAFYWPVPLLIAAYAIGLRARAPATARGLAAGAGLLVLSLAFRSVDQAACGAFPLGTHFLWHILNAVMLGWMIEVYVRHRLAQKGRGR